MADLLVTAFTPALSSGRALRTYAITRALAALGPLDLLYVRFDGAEPAAAFRDLARVTLHRLEPSRGPARATRYLRTLLAGVPSSYARGISEELVRSAERLGTVPGRGRVVADGPIPAVALRRLASRRPVIFSAASLESVLDEQTGKWGGLAQRKMRRFERRLLETAAEAWCPSRREIETARRLAPEARVRYVPNAIDVQRVEPVEPTTGGAVIFVADFTYPPNREGLVFLLESVMPRVWSRHPTARVVLVGRGLGPSEAGAPRVETRGFVEDLRSVYVEAACAVVPLQRGSGSPLKFLEALAYGVPVVSTPAGAAGLEVSADEHYRRGSDPEEFAAHVADLLENGAPETAARGRELAERAYSIEALSDMISQPLAGHSGRV
jgi:glycosyltransferase involved in cell wall biosynthesis